MTETNAERLENMSPIGVDQDGNMLVKHEDWFWLQEQVERAQGLEDHLFPAQDNAHQEQLNYLEVRSQECLGYKTPKAFLEAHLMSEN